MGNICQKPNFDCFQTCCGRRITQYQYIDHLYEVDEMSIMLDVISNFKQCSLKYVQESILKHHNNQVNFYIVKPEFKDTIVDDFLFSITNYLLTNFKVKEIHTIQKEEISTIQQQEHTKNVIFHFTKQLNFDEIKTQFDDIFILCDYDKSSIDLKQLPNYELLEEVKTVSIFVEKQ